MLDVFVRCSLLLACVAAGGCASILELDHLTYELQVREPGSRLPIMGATVRAERGPASRDYEGATDQDGRYRLDVTIPPFTASIGPSRSPWLRVAISKEGFEPRVLDLESDDFIAEGRCLRRAEAVTLCRGPK